MTPTRDELQCNAADEGPTRRVYRASPGAFLGGPEWSRRHDVKVLLGIASSR